MAEEAAKEKGGSIATTIAAIAGLVAAIPALIVAVISLMQAWDARKGADAAKAGARLERETPQTSPQAGGKFVVQLATYTPNYCSAAEAEIKLYGHEFNLEKPSLWLTPSGTVVVVGIQTTSRERADVLKAQAIKLSENSKYEDESLEDASVRNNPPWTAIKSCKDAPTKKK